MKDNKTGILEYLRTFHKGVDKAVFSRELQFVFQLDGRNIRRNIAKLRQEGYPICSGENGYYYAQTQSEVNSTAKMLTGFISTVRASRKGLLSAAVNASESEK